MGRPPLGERKMTPAERKRRQRTKIKDSQPGGNDAATTPAHTQDVTNEERDAFIKLLIDHVNKMLSGLCVGEMQTNRRLGAHYFMNSIFDAIHNLTADMQYIGFFPGLPPPITIVAHLAQALFDLEEGIVDPILSPAADRRISIVDDEAIRGVRPGLPKTVQTGRIIAVVAMELLMHADKRRGRVQRAAQTVAVILKDHPLLTKCRGVPLRTIQHWRSNIAEGHVDSRIISQFNSMLQEATRLVREAGGTPAHYVAGAHKLLQFGMGP
jgi:hypothetical protein